MVKQDRIASMRKVGHLDDWHSAEIFFTFEKFGEYSIDPFTCQDFENFWLNSHPGSEVTLRLADNGSIYGVKPAHGK